MTETLTNVFQILVFPGIVFLSVFAMAAEYIDRKLCAKMQNRVGPPWYQPLADFIKLSAKEDVVPVTADSRTFKLMPIVALAAVVTAFLYIPVWGTQAMLGFDGDLIVVLYLLTIPTLTFFLAGWFSGSPYSIIGAIRTLTQLFAYEIPLFLSLLAPSLLVQGDKYGSWSLSGMTAFYNDHPALVAVNVIGFAVALVALLGKLERVPFDIPEAETEIVAGTFTEYSGRLLAMFRMAINIEMVVGASLLAAVFLPFGLGLSADATFAGKSAVFGLYLVKVIFVVAILAVLRTIMARLRIDQMIHFCWRYLAPIAFVQLLVDLVVKGMMSR